MDGAWSMFEAVKLKGPQRRTPYTVCTSSDHKKGDGNMGQLPHATPMCYFK